MRARFRPNMGKRRARRCGQFLVRARVRADVEYRAINLTKNSQFYVRQGDVERLIAQGYLQKLA